MNVHMYKQYLIQNGGGTVVANQGIRKPFKITYMYMYVPSSRMKNNSIICHWLNQFLYMYMYTYTYIFSQLPKKACIQLVTVREI